MDRDFYSLNICAFGAVLAVPIAEDAAVDAILFEDELVRSICVFRWDAGKDGETLCC